jgi:hypothetical protein
MAADKSSCRPLRHRYGLVASTITLCPFVASMQAVCNSRDGRVQQKRRRWLTFSKLSQIVAATWRNRNNMQLQQQRHG